MTRPAGACTLELDDLTPQAAAEIAAEHFGISAAATRLAGERDAIFRPKPTSATRWC